jgi:16S rRNA (cytidine1402-2'-O)-methyltransferase
LKLIAEGKSVAYVSEAGTPLVSDPGYALARDVGAAGHLVTAAPGASAVLAALSLSGLPSDRFLFAGFAPTQQTARRRWLEELAPVPATLVIYESPRRVREILADLCDIAGEERRAALCRELTKKFEEVLRGTLGELVEAVAARAQAGRDMKGEIVLLVDRGHAEVAEDTMEDALRRAMADMSLKDAAATVAEAYGLPRRKVYQAALEMEKK